MESERNWRPIVHARASDLEVSATDGSLLRVMFAPAGDSEITCGLGDDSAAEVVIRVDQSTAAVLDAALAKINAENAPQRALFDFEHEHRQAMAWPIHFEWSAAPKPGVYAIAEFSSVGKEYVQGKVVRAFSGSFYSDATFPKRKDLRKGVLYKVKDGERGSPQNPARIVGLYFPYAGTLTNNPAFSAIEPLFAVRGVLPDTRQLAKLESQRALTRLEQKHALLLMERNNQLLSQLIRKPPECVSQIDARIRQHADYLQMCRKNGLKPNLKFHR